MRVLIILFIKFMLSSYLSYLSCTCALAITGIQCNQLKKRCFMDLESLIKGYEKEVEMEEAATAAKKKLIADLKIKAGIFDKQQKEVKAVKPSQPAYIQDSDEIIDVDLLLPETTRKPSFIDEVREIIKRFGAKEFTVQHVDMVLKDRLGLPSDDVSQRPRISQALSKLKDAGYIEMKIKGTGNAPNRYVVSQHKSDDKDQ